MKNRERSNAERIETIKKGVADNKHVFLLIYMDGCGPCNETKPRWFEFENKHGHNDDNIVIEDIEQGHISDIANIIGESPGGFPCMRYIKNGKVEEYEDCANLDKTKLRSAESFSEWLKLKTGSNKKHQSGGKKQTKRSKKNKSKGKKGGKWSLKYKRSINCKRPRGFSQRQHCKYGKK